MIEFFLLKNSNVQFFEQKIGLKLKIKERKVFTSAILIALICFKNLLHQVFVQVAWLMRRFLSIYNFCRVEKIGWANIKSLNTGELCFFLGGGRRGELNSLRTIMFTWSEYFFHPCQKIYFSPDGFLIPQSLSQLPHKSTSLPNLIL